MASKLLDPKDLKIISLEKDLEFVNKEHAFTLKSLHNEVEKLQSRCKELTFELAMETTSKVDTNELQEELKQHKAEIKEKDATILGLKKQVDSQGKTISEQKNCIQTMETNNETNIKDKDAKILQLTTENVSKGDEVARLQMTVLNLRRELKQYKKSAEQTRPEGLVLKPELVKGIPPVPRRKLSRESSSFSVESSHSSGSGSVDNVPMHVPTPPVSHEGVMASRKQSHRKQQATRVLNQPKLRPASGRRLTMEGSSAEPIVDTTDILRITREQRASLRMSQFRTSLPPGNIDGRPFEVPADLPHSAVRISSVGSNRRGDSRQSSPEIETLALDVHKDLHKNTRHFNSYGADT